MTKVTTIEAPKSPIVQVQMPSWGTPAEPDRLLPDVVLSRTKSFETKDGKLAETGEKVTRCGYQITPDGKDILPDHSINQETTREKSKLKSDLRANGGYPSMAAMDGTTDGAGKLNGGLRIIDYDTNRILGRTGKFDSKTGDPVPGSFHLVKPTTEEASFLLAEAGKLKQVCEDKIGSIKSTILKTLSAAKIDPQKNAAARKAKLQRMQHQLRQFGVVPKS